MKLTVENACRRLESKRWSVRKRGMEMLVELGERDLILEYALHENTPAVFDLAANALYPEPTELLLHMVTAVKGPDANLCMRFHIPFGNYQYAAEGLADVYRRRKSRLHFEVIEAAGLAELLPFADYLGKYLRAPLETFKSARDKGDNKAIAGVPILVSSDGSDTWSRPSACAIEAAVALRRLGVDFDRAFVDRMRYELTEAMEDCYTRRETSAKLLWVLYDLGDKRHYPALVNSVMEDVGSIAPDLLTTLLRRGAYDKAQEIVRNLADIYTKRGEFHFWPLCDYLQSLGLLEANRLHIEYYTRARSLGISPPSWWSWTATT